jgi:hypothetical protein
MTVARPAVHPPYEVRQRAWEAAYVMRDQPIPLADKVRAEVAFRIGPDRLGWAECRDMLAMCRVYWGERV